MSKWVEVAAGLIIVFSMSVESVHAQVWVDPAPTGGNIHYVDGNVGIGTDNPGYSLDVLGSIRLVDNDSDGASKSLVLFNRSYFNANNDVLTLWGVSLQNQNLLRIGSNHTYYTAPTKIELFTAPDTTSPGQLRFVIRNDGNVGIGLPNPTVALDVAGDVHATGLDIDGSMAANDLNISGVIQAGGLQLGGATQTTAFDGNSLDALGGGSTNEVYVDSSGNVGIGDTTPQAKLDVNGRARVTEIEITGADLAEPFPVETSATPGMVVCIDAENHGALRISNTPYDRTVVGVISGAGDIFPGIIMANDELVEGNQPVALTGRVNVFADQGNGIIAPGDLLTTSATAGHVMKVTDHTKANGAILGKAMGGVNEETGMVLMIVALQ